MRATWEARVNTKFLIQWAWGEARESAFLSGVVDAAGLGFHFESDCTEADILCLKKKEGTSLRNVRGVSEC